MASSSAPSQHEDKKEPMVSIDLGLNVSCHVMSSYLGATRSIKSIKSIG